MSADPFTEGWLSEHLRHVMADIKALPPRLRPRLTGRRAVYNEWIGSEPLTRPIPTDPKEG